MQIITNNAGKELKKHGDNAFPFLVSYERLSGYETGSFLWHWHPEIELTYVKKGEMLYKVNQNTFHLKEGQALFGNANAQMPEIVEEILPQTSPAVVLIFSQAPERTDLI